jgi:hypothetical protein
VLGGRLRLDRNFHPRPGRVIFLKPHVITEGRNNVCRGERSQREDILGGSRFLPPRTECWWRTCDWSRVGCADLYHCSNFNCGCWHRLFRVASDENGIPSQQKQVLDLVERTWIYCVATCRQMERAGGCRPHCIDLRFSVSPPATALCFVIGRPFDC